MYLTTILLVPFDSVTHEGIQGRYQRMADAVANLATKTRTLPFYLSLCAWGWVSCSGAPVNYTDLLEYRIKFGSGARPKARVGGSVNSDYLIPFWI